MRIWQLLAAGLVGIASIASAEPTIDDAAWLAGRWVGTGLGGQVEEVWAPAAGGQMVGYFQLVTEGKPKFYELMLLDAQSPGLRLRVKHFNPDFTAWEDKGEWHTFKPVSVEPNLLKFEGLTIARSGDKLRVVVTLRSKDGTVIDHPLELRRMPL